MRIICCREKRERKEKFTIRGKVRERTKQLRAVRERQRRRERALNNVNQREFYTHTITKQTESTIAF